MASSSFLSVVLSFIIVALLHINHHDTTSSCFLSGISNKKKMTFGNQDRVDGNHSIDGDSTFQSPTLTVDPEISCPVEAINDLVSRAFPDEDLIINEATMTNLIQQLTAIIGTTYYSSLRDTDEFGMTLLHLVAEKHGMSYAFRAVLEVYQNFNVENCFGLLRMTEQGDTPIQFLAYDEDSFYHFFDYVEAQCPELMQKRDFVCEVFLNLLLHFGENTDEFAIDLRDLLTRYPNALDPGTCTVEESSSVTHTVSSSSSSPSASSIMDNHTTERVVIHEVVSCSSQVLKSLLHQYCSENIGGPDSKVLAVLLEEGKNRPTLINGGLTYADLFTYSPLHNILQKHLLRKCFDKSVEGKSEENWDCVDTCVRCVGIVPVYCSSLIFFPMKFMTIGISQLEASCNFIVERYKHLLQDFSNDDLLHMYNTFAATCNSLRFCGKLDALYYKRLFEVCFLKGQMHRINFNNENILYIAIRDNVDWWKGLQFIFKESGKAIADRSNEFELPAPLFAAAVGSNLDTIYELFRGDVGLFGEM